MFVAEREFLWFSISFSMIALPRHGFDRVKELREFLVEDCIGEEPDYIQILCGLHSRIDSLIAYEEVYDSDD